MAPKPKPSRDHEVSLETSSSSSPKRVDVKLKLVLSARKIAIRLEDVYREFRIVESVCQILRDRSTDLQHSLDQGRKKLQSLKEVNERLKRAIGRVQTEIGVPSQELLQKLSLLTAQNVAYNSLLDDNQRCVRHIQELEITVKTRTAECECFNQEVSALKDRVLNLQSLEHSSCPEEIKAKNDEAGREILKFEKDICSVRVDIDTLRKENKMLMVEADAQNSSTAHLGKANAELNLILDLLKKEIGNPTLALQTDVCAILGLPSPSTAVSYADKLVMPAPPPAPKRLSAEEVKASLFTYVGPSESSVGVCKLKDCTSDHVGHSVETCRSMHGPDQTQHANMRCINEIRGEVCKWHDLGICYFLHLG